MKRAMRGGLALALIGLPAVACQVIAGIEDRSTGEVTVPSDATSDAPPARDASVDGPLEACALATVPEAPSGDDDDASTDITIVMAMSAIRLPNTVASSAPKASGFDLDGVCTCCTGCAPTGPTCRNGAGKGTCDLALGVDNGGGPLFDDLGAFNTLFTEQSVNSGILAGQATVLLQVQHYNDNDDDPSVEISFFDSLGDYLPDGGMAKPQFNGSDMWTYSTSSVLDPDAAVPTDNPAFRSTKAYVRGHNLYAKLDTLDVVLGNVPLHLTGAILSGTLVSQGGTQYGIQNGMLGARWPTANVLEQFGPGVLTDCSQGSLYNTLKTGVCVNADLTADPSMQGNGSEPLAQDPVCNAISVQMSFDAVPALFGGQRPPVPLNSTCPGFSDDCQ